MKPKRQSHNVSAPFVTIPTRYETCQHYSYSNRQLVQCGAPTENGCHTCNSCKALEAKGTGQARKDSIATYVR